MCRMRFAEPLDASLSLQQIRGREGIRVREAYARASRDTGVEWSGRSYRRDRWEDADPINRALSSANSALYGICQAAIVSAGYSPALGFVHTGKMLSFVYDIADLYKVDFTIPVAFSTVAEGTADLEGRVRRACRDIFHARRLLSRIVPDIERCLAVEGAEARQPSISTPTRRFRRSLGPDSRRGSWWREPGGRGRGWWASMVVIMVERVPASVRGELTRWMLEPRAGVFVGSVSAMVRDRLWEKVCGSLRGGAGMLVYSADNEQGFSMRLWGSASRSIADFDGLLLIRKP